MQSINVMAVFESDIPYQFANALQKLIFALYRKRTEIVPVFANIIGDKYGLLYALMF